MGQRLQIVAFLCGAFKKKEPPPDAAPTADAAADEEDAAPEAEDPISNIPSPSGGDGSPLPPPPGTGHHMRAASCSNHRSGTGAASKMVASVSMKALGSAAAAVGRQASRREHKPKKLKPEESIWKKTIILGEKCRVPDEEDEENIMYDEKGKRIPAYHPKSQSGVFSRQNSVNISSSQQQETSTK